MRFAILVCLAVSAVLAPVSAQSNDPFLRTLTREGPLNRARLAEFVERTSATLAEARDGVALLQVAAESDAPGRPYVVEATGKIQERFEAYAAALGEFEEASHALVRLPRSERRLFGALAAGLNACRLHDSHVALAESYGVNAGRLRTVLRTGAACSRLQHVAFQPRVLEVIDRALVDGRDQSEWVQENVALREELAALEQLLEDLRELE